MDRKLPNLFLYSLALPVVWFALAFLTLNLAPNVEVGIAGSVVTVYLATIFICRHFSKSFKRYFEKGEKIRLAIYMVLWMGLIRCLSLYGLDEGLSSKELMLAIGVILGIDFLIIASSVFSVSHKFNKFFLRRYNAGNA
ncbi:hypothetical protein LMH66_14625 [Shewanella sp. 10N.7]|uniref:hypothetical protein n=1 Tax=Shewanella sp. 10N.7 TaxID=2885093 RepID=UPI001E2D3FAA|nr:hypothetical protein [Shewanella sp. 10N.7]MCC4833876.1 hypothetical protein [Shewanella sp. 10N.7]